MDDEDKKSSSSIKITLIGDSAVGKTCIITRYTSNEFNPESLTTNGVAYSKKEIIHGNKVVHLDVWDTAGQEKYRSLGKHFYKDSFIVILVYNITQRETFENLKNVWMKEVTDYGEKCKVLAVVGNKCDLYEQEAVPEEDARKFALEHDAIFMNVSAKDGTNIDLLFETCVKKYFEPTFQLNIVEEKKRDEKSVKIRKNSKAKHIGKAKKKCCN